MKKRVTVKIPKGIILIVALLFVCAIIKVSYVVLSKEVDGINLQEKAASISTVTKTLYSNRGSIFDANGDELATTVNAYTVIAYLNESRTTDPENPRHVVDKEKTAKELAPLLNMTEERILEAAKSAFESGWSTIKLYFILGLPYETTEDAAGGSY